MKGLHLRRFFTIQTQDFFINGLFQSRARHNTNVVLWLSELQSKSKSRSHMCLVDLSSFHLASCCVRVGNWNAPTCGACSGWLVSGEDIYYDVLCESFCSRTRLNGPEQDLLSCSFRRDPRNESTCFRLGACVERNSMPYHVCRTLRCCPSVSTTPRMQFPTMRHFPCHRNVNNVDPFPKEMVFDTCALPFCMGPYKKENAQPSLRRNKSPPPNLAVEEKKHTI